MSMTDRVKAIAGCFPVVDEQQIMLVTDGGQLIRMPVTGIRIAGRMTQGVMLFRVSDDEKVVSVAAVDDEEEDDDILDGDGEGGNSEAEAGNTEPSEGNTAEEPTDGTDP
ncbi:MAG: DNA gyrase C-terminal beta-propeller domain-containing protein [Pseudomonadota bacterium]